MSVEIRETIVTSSPDGDVVQLHISDAKLGDESAEIVLRLTVPIPTTTAPLLAHVQRHAIKKVDAILTEQLQKLAAVIRGADRDLES